MEQVSFAVVTKTHEDWASYDDSSSANSPIHQSVAPSNGDENEQPARGNSNLDYWLS